MGLSCLLLPITQNVVIREGTDQFERWLKLPQPMHFRSYLFNITNPEEVKQGAAPIVEEIGPYVYRYGDGDNR